MLQRYVLYNNCFVVSYLNFTIFKIMFLNFPWNYYWNMLVCNFFTVCFMKINICLIVKLKFCFIKWVAFLNKMKLFSNELCVWNTITSSKVHSVCLRPFRWSSPDELQILSCDFVFLNENIFKRTYCCFLHRLWQCRLKPLSKKLSNLSIRSRYI